MKKNKIYYQILIYDKSNKLVKTYTTINNEKSKSVLIKDPLIKPEINQLKHIKIMSIENIISHVKNYKIQINRIKTGYNVKKDKVLTILK